ncbi:M15 family metallopeptidase [Zwartia vadi]|uniref:M15 family metallopeptidase n=1 Tax=Zwartia vadi TaxID=3058168 RepID=UPI0025B29F3E|nr:M15 family metallopeptidase [Zwartia vadi]MDN3987910.1 M15 family metallopeptidase [Zwartia vadi]
MLNKLFGALTGLCLMFSSAVAAQTTMPDEFVYLDEWIPALKIDLRYSSKNNFIGAPVDGYADARAVLTRPATLALAKVQQDLDRQGYGLLIFDTYRPKRAVEHFMRWMADPNDQLAKATFYPALDKKDLRALGYISGRSGHSRGSTVDLTLFAKNAPDGELDMGSVFDFFGPESGAEHPSLTPTQVKNRQRLREVMVKHGFTPYSKEWWHFSFKNEPFPNQYFDFLSNNPARLVDRLGSFQLVIATAPDWKSKKAILSTYERMGGKWVKKMDGVPVILGKSGSAWGRGLHPEPMGVLKREGDGKAPAGIFDFGLAFGYAATAQTKMPYQGMESSNYCIDVIGSPLYNTIVDTRKVGLEAIKGSTEPMRLDLTNKGDQQYVKGLVIQQNPKNESGLGSCVFMHVWSQPNGMTLGCTAMDAHKLDQIMSWLDPDKRPLYVLLPRAEYQKYQAAWGLPEQMD